MNKEMYEDKCEEKFLFLQKQINDCEQDRKRIKKVLFGNGDEGVVDTQRNHTRYFRCMWGLIIFIASLAAVQTAIAVRTHMTDDTEQKKLTVLMERVSAELEK
jgi:hypothetical protein